MRQREKYDNKPEKKPQVGLEIEVYCCKFHTFA